MYLKKKNVDLNDIDVVVGRGGLLKPIPNWNICYNS